MGNPPSQKEIATWHRWFAIELNNLAWEIAENPERTPAQREEMLNAAHASAIHWNNVGTDLNRARSDMLLAQVHGLLGDGPQATHYAERCRQYFSDHECPDWEKAFVHAVMANASYASGDRSRYQGEYDIAKRLGASISDDAEKEVFMRTFSQLPTPV
jgi:hypothetical protein